MLVKAAVDGDGGADRRGAGPLWTMMKSFVPSNGCLGGGEEG